MKLLKRVFSITLILIFALTCFAQKKGQNKKDDNGKQGEWKYFNRDGDLLYIINYKNDKKHGPCVKYYPQAGKPREESNYYDGKLDEDFKQYYVNGEVKREGFYKDGKREGLWTSYDRITGEKRSEGNYKENKKVDEWSYWNSKGNLVVKGKYVNGQKDGVWEYYDAEGKVKSRQTFVNGKAAGSDDSGSSTVKKETKKTTNKKGVPSKSGQETPPPPPMPADTSKTNISPSDTTRTK